MREMKDSGIEWVGQIPVVRPAKGVWSSRWDSGLSKV